MHSLRSKTRSSNYFGYCPEEMSNERAGWLDIRYISKSSSEVFRDMCWCNMRVRPKIFKIPCWGSLSQIIRPAGNSACMSWHSCTGQQWDHVTGRRWILLESWIAQASCIQSTSSIVHQRPPSYKAPYPPAPHPHYSAQPICCSSKASLSRYTSYQSPPESFLASHKRKNIQ